MHHSPKIEDQCNNQVTAVSAVTLSVGLLLIGSVFTPKTSVDRSVYCTTHVRAECMSYSQLLRVEGLNVSV